MSAQSKTKKHITNIVGVVLCFVLFLLTFNVRAAKTEISFKKKETVQQSNELASNMLRIVNGSDKPLKFLLSLNIPNGWKNLNANNRSYQINAGDSMFIPVKLLFKGNEEGDVSYLVIASLVSESNNLQFASSTWYVEIKKQSEWSASVNKTESFFINNSDTSSVSLMIQNTGNSPETFSVKISPHFQLQVFEIQKMKDIVAPFNIRLAPQTDTVISFLVRSKPLQTDKYQTANSREKESTSNEKLPVRISVISASKTNAPGKMWKSTVNFRKSTNEAKYNEYSRMMLPMTVEMKLDNIFENATILNFNLYGDAKLERSRSLSYRFQSFFTDQYFNSRAFRGNYHYLGYFTPRAGVEAGNITGWGNFGQTPSGKGIKGEYKLAKNKIGLMYIQNPDLFVSPSIRNIGARHELVLKEISIANYLQHTWNDLAKTTGNLFITGGDFRIRHQHIFSLRAGGSTENFYNAPSPFTKTGVGTNFNYSGTVKNFSFRLSSTYGSKYYTGYRGIFNLNYGISYKPNLKHTWSFTNSFYEQSPVYFDQVGNEINGYKSKNERYELRLSIAEKGNNYSVRASYYYDELFTIRYMTRGIGLDYRPVSSASQVRFFSSLFASYIKLPDYDIKDYFTAQVRTSLRYKNFTSNFRYNYGPYQAFEQIRFANYQTNHQSVFANIYYGLWLLQHRISLEPAINFSHETLYKRNRLSIRPEFFYFSKSGLEFSMYADYLVNAQKVYRLNEATSYQSTEEKTVNRNFLFGIGLKKQFGLPIPGKKYCTASVVIFKDLNGNLIQDKNEESIENVLVTLRPVLADSSKEGNSDLINERGEDLITDAKGRVYFRNLPAGIYEITTKPLTENSGWFPVTDHVIVLNKSREVFLPFAQGVRLAGAILVDHNNSAIASNANPELSRIRVTAADSAGRTYSALTAIDGNFELYVPAGNYRISLNAKAVDDNYTVVQSSIPVSLAGKSGTYNVSFHLTERERKINIKKFNADGTVINTTPEDH